MNERLILEHANFAVCEIAESIHSLDRRIKKLENSRMNKIRRIIDCLEDEKKQELIDLIRRIINET